MGVGTDGILRFFSALYTWERAMEAGGELHDGSGQPDREERYAGGSDGAVEEQDDEE